MRKQAHKKDGLLIPEPDEALRTIAEDGVTDVLVQPIYIICGTEYGKVQEACKAWAGHFKSMRIGEPLLASQNDLEELADRLPSLPGKNWEREGAVLAFLGHGSSSEPSANKIYIDLEETLISRGYENVLIGTIDGPPGYEHILNRLDQLKPSKVVLMPLLLSAGSHVLRDMQGEREGSLKDLIEKAGYPVEAIAKGIGEFDEIRNMFAEHAQRAEIAFDRE